MTLLQWGRNFIVAEILQRLKRTLRHRLASMGPQLYRCGNYRTALVHFHSGGRFNGAATLSLRKFAIPMKAAAATPTLQWGRNFIVAEILQRLKRTLRHRLASMGPQLYRCGNYRTALVHFHSGGRFNGAATLSLRKFAIPMKAAAATPTLQWGRNFIVAEMPGESSRCSTEAKCFNGAATLSLRKSHYPTPRSPEIPCASMGPQLYRCGNLRSR